MSMTQFQVGDIVKVIDVNKQHIHHNAWFDKYAPVFASRYAYDNRVVAFLDDYRIVAMHKDDDSEDMLFAITGESSSFMHYPKPVFLLSEKELKKKVKESDALLSVEETWQWLKDHYDDEHFDTLFGMETCVDEIPDTFEEVRKKISVYEAERKEEKEPAFYNGKVFCLDNKYCDYTVGKIYQFKYGKIMSDSERVQPENRRVHSFEEWANWSNAKWMEVIE